MSLPLEDEIMREIGLGCNFRFYNGSDSCRGIRLSIVHKLRKALVAANESGKEIAIPYEPLIEVLEAICSLADKETYVLTKAWAATSDVIRAHISAFNNPDYSWETVIQNIKERFPVEQGIVMSYDMDIQTAFARMIDK